MATMEPDSFELAIPMISVTIAVVSLIISLTTAWLTFFRRGTARMTQPTVIFFGHDGLGGVQKVFLRTLLYSTSKRGQMIENLFVKLHRGESVQTFNIWVYGENSLVRGSGLYIGEDGIAHNHHFLLPKDGSNYDFLPGDYTIEVYAAFVNRKKTALLFKTRVTLTPQQGAKLKEGDAGVYFDWGPDSKTYHSHVDIYPMPDWSKHI